MSFIPNGKNVPLNANSGTMPNVADAMYDWFQPMIFGILTNQTEGFQSYQEIVHVSTQGVWQPLSEQQLLMKPEGQRKWKWFWLHCEPGLDLVVDSVVKYLGEQYRVMSRKDYRLNGYLEYQLINDYTGSGPEVVDL